MKVSYKAVQHFKNSLEKSNVGTNDTCVWLFKEQCLWQQDGPLLTEDVM